MKIGFISGRKCCQLVYKIHYLDVSWAFAVAAVSKMDLRDTNIARKMQVLLWELQWERLG
jgi:hypothetical protein